MSQQDPVVKCRKPVDSNHHETPQRQRIKSPWPPWTQGSATTSRFLNMKGPDFDCVSSLRWPCSSWQLSATIHVILHEVNWVYICEVWNMRYSSCFQFGKWRPWLWHYTLFFGIDLWCCTCCKDWYAISISRSFNTRLAFLPSWWQIWKTQVVLFTQNCSWFDSWSFICLSFLGLDHLVVQGIDKTGIGICTPQDGLVVQVSDRFSKSVQESVVQFMARRPLRRACDYARPFHWETRDRWCHCTVLPCVVPRMTVRAICGLSLYEYVYRKTLYIR